MKVEKLFFVEMEVDNRLNDNEKEDVLSKIDLSAWDIEEMVKKHFECRDFSDNICICVYDAFVINGEVSHHHDVALIG
jgi:hypothetical protein